MPRAYRFSDISIFKNTVHHKRERKPRVNTLPHPLTLPILGVNIQLFHGCLVNSIQLFHACLGNSQNCCPEVPWTARCTIARGRKAEANGASSCPRYRGAVVLSFLPNSQEITVLLPNQC